MKKLSVLLALGGMIALPCIQRLQAQVVTFTFEAPVLTGDWAGEVGVGSFSIDGTLIVPPYTGDVGPMTPVTGSMSLTFTILGQTFSDSDDSGYPTFPLLSLVDGAPQYLSFWIEEPGTSINEPGAEVIFLEGFLGDSLGGYDYKVQANVLGTKPVPEPSAVAFSVVAALGLGAFVVRRRRAKVS